MEFTGKRKIPRSKLEFSKTISFHFPQEFQECSGQLLSGSTVVYRRTFQQFSIICNFMGNLVLFVHISKDPDLLLEWKVQLP